MSAKRFRAVLFDWDDTLCYGTPHRYDDSRVAAARVGVEITRREVHLASVRAATMSEFDFEVFRERFPFELGIPEEFHKAFRVDAFLRDSRKEWRIFDDVLEVIDHLSKRDLKVGLLSNNVNVALRATTLDVHHHFAVIVSPDTYGVSKPNPRIFIETLAAMEVDPEQAIYVGDSYNDDVTGARAAGMTPVLIDRYDLMAGDHDVEHYIATLTALDEVLEGLINA